MDFYRIKERSPKPGVVEIYPDFRIMRSKDLMIRAKSFYAIWDEKAQLWSTDEYDVQRLVDEELMAFRDDARNRNEGNVSCKFLGDFSTNSWLQFRNYVGHLTDSATQLDENLTFANSVVKKEDFVSRKLPYSLTPGSIAAWDEIVGTLYNEDERAKIEWAIGSIVAGDSKYIQKFLVFYGAMGTGKSTILNIIQMLFEGYTTSFVAKDLTSVNNNFALEAFKGNPLVAIEHDGNLSKIQDNSRLNSLVSHEWMLINEKNKPQYRARFNAMLMIGSNNPVMITDSKSGLIRRLIDIHPTGDLLSQRRYSALMGQIPFELGAIAQHCYDVYKSMGKDYYASYRPVEMMLQTDVFFNYIEASYDVFKAQDGVTLKQAYDMFKEYAAETNLERVMPRYKFREELRNYFDKFEDRADIDGVRVRSWYSGFNADHFKTKEPEDKNFSLVMEETVSLLDDELSSFPAQYSKEDGSPYRFWNDKPRQRNGKEFIPKPSQVNTFVLSDLDTSKEHYVKVPENHIVIDFDLTDNEGNKSAERSLEAAATWPSTYAEFSKSGNGVHLHYYYDGDVSELARLYDVGIEIKVYRGDTSLRRRLTKCNNVPIAHINSGLPLKEKKVINVDTIKSEKSLRDLIERNLRKEIHADTASSVSFIHKILEDAYAQGLTYDVSNMQARLISFAAGSTNQSDYCLKLVMTMKYQSENASEDLVSEDDQPIVFYDVEVFPNLFIICWKYEGSGNVVRMINPTAQQVEEFMRMKLVGFNVRRYDNHIIYGAYMGYSNLELYKLSKRIINGDRNAFFREAYNLSYTDIYDYSSKKQSLKKWEIELGLKHLELGLDWDKPVPEELWDKVAKYCDNDVISTEETHKARRADFMARQILAELSGLSVNSTTQQHASKIVFGENRKPQSEFVYTDLSEMFPGYKYVQGKSFYKGEITGEGGYVYEETGVHYNVALLDVASMHPTSIEALNLFGEEYTRNFSSLKKARIAIKHGDYDAAKEMLNGKLAPYLGNPEEAGALSDALKIVINIVYGLTSASFENSFRDPRNIDNIVAKRGALFMVDLKLYVQSLGYTVVHIKTDSIKIAEATPEIIDLVMEFGEEYGYTFEHEATYEKMCLVNKAVYVAKTVKGKKPAQWTATGKQFQEPVVFKTLFSHEQITFEDYCQTMQVVASAMYLDFTSDEDDTAMIFSEGPKRQFIGKVGQFVPVRRNGGLLVKEKEGKFHAVTGTKGFRWLEAEVVRNMDNPEDEIDLRYYDELVTEAMDAISKFGDGDFDAFAA